MLRQHLNRNTLHVGRTRLALLGAIVVGLCLASSASRGQQQPLGDTADLIEKGRYLATAADCSACHTNPNGGKAYAGGYPIETPFGVIYSTNITPSKVAGIGDYTQEQFAHAVRDGIRGDGAHLYPAMPYKSYGLLTDSDIQALWAYFTNDVAAVDASPTGTKLPFPFNLRISMVGWNLLFRDAHRFVPDPGRNAEQNRGAYLINALGHCGACHTPRNFLMAEESDRVLAGAPLSPWYAPNITADPISGIGGWSDDELVQYLRTGDAPGKNQAAAGMAEAVEHSLQFLTETDLRAMVAYLRGVPAIRSPNDSQATYTFGRPAAFEQQLRGAASAGAAPASANDGERLFSGNCASCHQPTGGGTADHAYPSLFHNTATGISSPNNLVSAILFGVDRTVGGKQILMPRFDGQSFVQPLSDAQIAAISTYVLHQFGNPALSVTSEQVSALRQGEALPR